MTKFGKYVLLAELGHGGMADVFLTVSNGPEGLGFRKLIVIKRLRRALVQDPEFVTMLVDEGRLAARLNHPNTVQTHEIGEVDGEYFIAMEYLDGQPLSRIQNRLRKEGKRLPTALAVSLMIDALAGIHYAHELRDYDGAPIEIVHRDVTPHNIFVTYDGQVKVVDFGVAKARGRLGHTSTGVIKGKVFFMAPEQALASSMVDRRTDVFGAGVVLWEMLVGGRYWGDDDENTVFTRLHSGNLPPSPIVVAPDVDPELDRICRRALARLPEERYATADEMATDLLAYQRARETRSTPRELGAFVAGQFEDLRLQTRLAIEKQLAAAAEEGGLSKILHVPDADRAPSTPPAAELPVRAESRSRRWVAPAVGLACIAAIVGSVVLVGKRAPAPRATVANVTGLVQDEAPSPPPVSPLAPESKRVEKVVRVELSSTVPGARFRIDGGPFSTLPFRAPMVKDGVHKVEISAPGYKDQSRDLRFEDVVSWHAVLVPSTPPPRRAPAAPPPVRPAAPSANVLAAKASPAVDSTPEPTMRRSRRSIDTENPY